MASALKTRVAKNRPALENKLGVCKNCEVRDAASGVLAKKLPKHEALQARNFFISRPFAGPAWHDKIGSRRFKRARTENSLHVDYMLLTKNLVRSTAQLARHLPQ